MKILAIGDIHGKEIWKEAVAAIPADQIVFLGDYIKANRWIFNNQIRRNLEAILVLKRMSFDHVHLLIGNHDIPYLCPDIFPASELRRMISQKMFRLYSENKECFEAACAYKQFLFTHAGISRSWYQTHRSVLASHPGTNIAEKLNSIQRSGDFRILHEKGRARGGPFQHGGITYADKVETENNGLDGYIQIVGHTKVNAPVVSKNKKGSVIYIDCLNAVNEFLYIDEDKVSAITLDGRKRDLTVS